MGSNWRCDGCRSPTLARRRRLDPGRSRDILSPPDFRRGPFGVRPGVPGRQVTLDWLDRSRGVAVVAYGPLPRKGWTRLQKAASLGSRSLPSVSRSPFGRTNLAAARCPRLLQQVTQPARGRRPLRLLAFPQASPMAPSTGPGALPPGVCPPAKGALGKFPGQGGSGCA
jgi:hypothetical protein